MARKKKEEEQIVSDIIESEKVESKIIEEAIKTEEKKRFLTCPFCKTISYTHTGRDETSSWCEKCGRCYSVNWQEV